MNMPTNGSAVQIAAQAMTDQALALRLDIIIHSPRSMKRDERDAYVAEAQRRLLWGRKSEADRIAALESELAEANACLTPPDPFVGFPGDGGPVVCKNTIEGQR